MRHLLLLPAICASVFLIPAAALGQGSTECDERNDHFDGPAPDYYFCTRDRGPNPFDDCYHVGVFLPVVQRVEYHRCP